MKKIGKVERMRYLMFALVLSVSNYGLAAAAAYGQNAANWASDQLGAIAGVVTGAIVFSCVAKRNTVGAIGSLILGGVCTYLVYNPEKIETIGETIASIILK